VIGLSIVSIVKRRGRTVEDAVREAVELAGGLGKIVKRRSRVLVKPNLVRPSESGSGVITDCRVTEAVTKLVLEERPARVVIGEGSGYGYDVAGARADTLEAFKLSGTEDVAERLGVDLIDLNRDAVIEVEIPSCHVMDEVKIAKTAFESDVIISLPVLKVHRRTVVTLSLKNMKGVMPSREKKKTHRLGLERAIIDLNTVVKPDFTVVDGLVGLGGLWSKEDSENLNIILASQDPVAVDSVGAKVMGFDPSKILKLELASEKGLGTSDLQLIEVRGEPIASVAKRFLDPQKAFAERYPGVLLLDENSCSACEGELQSPLFYIRSAGCVDALDGLVVLMGVQKDVPKVSEKTVVMGQCVKEFQDRGFYVAGCPPRGWALTEAICEACDIDKKAVITAIERIHGDLSEIQ
jgi:uncharacterized protein (DUF362 family)